MRATLLVRERVVFADGAIIEIRILRIPNLVPPSTHGLKYSLLYGRPGERLLAYFKSDVEAMRGEPL